MLWIALGSSALVAALYFATYKFFNHTCATGESDDEWDARPSQSLSATLDERFARFWLGIIRNILNLASNNLLEPKKSIDLLSFSPLL